MEISTSVGVNVLCAALGLLVNLFYVFCLICPLRGKMMIKNPLLALLVLMIVCTSLFQFSLILYLVLEFMALSVNLRHVVEVVMFYLVRVSIPTSVWLNIFYCSQIVPVQRTFFVWFKKNIKPIMALFFIFSTIYFLVYIILEFLMDYYVNSTSIPPLGIMFNSTSANDTPLFVDRQNLLSQVVDTLDTVTMALVLLGLVIMLTVTGTTVHYLYEHIRKMTKSGKPFRSQPLLNQIRVTITGLVQGLLFLLCSTGMFLDVFCNYHKMSIDRHILWTLFSVYSLATMVNLGVGQSLFRQRVAQIWQKTSQVE